MVLKKLSQLLNGDFVDADSLSVSHAFSLGSVAMLGRLPEKLMSSMASFIKRNSLAIIGSSLSDKKPIHSCCPRCLKAYALRKAEEEGLNEEVKDELTVIFECERGHGGYYLDRGKLIRV